MIDERENEAAWERLTDVAKKVVTVLEQEGMTQGESLLVFSLAKAVLHHQPVKLPQVESRLAFACNFYDYYPDLNNGVSFPLGNSQR